MCAATSIRMQEKYLREWHVHGPPTWLMDSYNVAPTQQVPMCACLSASARLLWCVGGLSHFRQRRAGEVQHINARLETFETAASYVDRAGAASAAYSWRAAFTNGTSMSTGARRRT